MAINKNIGFISAAILLLLIVFLPHNIIWDEKWYLHCTDFLYKYGLTIDFLKHSPSAPIHTIIYYLFSSVAGMHALGVRLFNYALCICISFIIYKTFQFNREIETSQMGFAFSLFLMPGFFVLGFFALTEAPCLLLYMLSVYLLLKALSDNKNHILLAFLSGIFMGFAILTRQLFLACIFPSLAILFYRKSEKRFSTIIIYILVTLSICVPVFSIWKGILPPNTPIMPSTNGIISLKHLALSFGYALFYFILALPLYLYNFIIQHKRNILVLIVIAILVSFFINDNSFLPESGALSRLFSPKIVELIARLFFKMFVAFGLILLYFLLNELYERRNEFEQVFFILSMLAILSTPAFITHYFSSRYPLQIAPLLIIFAHSRMLPLNPKIRFLVNGICIVINLVSVITFFY